MERETSQRIKFLLPEEKRELICEIEKDTTIHGVRNKAIILISIYCALRASEVGLLKVSDYNREQLTIFCERLKGSMNNTLKIVDPEVVTALDDWLIAREYYVKKKGDSPYLFISQRGTPIDRKTLDRMIKKYCEKTGIDEDKRHFHVLKHTRAIELAEAGFDMKDIQYWLGHKNIANTFIYFQYTTSQQTRLYNMLEQKLQHKS